MQESTDVPQMQTRQIIFVAAASCLGWAFEFFDLLVLLYVAPVVGSLFFPSDRPMLSLAAVYSSFAVTLLMRPIGSAWLGAYADKFGRRKVLLMCLIGIGVVTALLGALPTTRDVGLIASIAFLFLRLLQGIFVGGVSACTGTMGIEAVPQKWRGLMSGLISGSAGGFGAFVASGIYWIVSSLYPGPAFAEWGWRVMFFSGIITSFLGMLVYRGLEESPIWAALHRERQARASKPGASSGTSTEGPLRKLLSPVYRRIFLQNLVVTIGGGAGFYLTAGFLPTYLKVVNHLSPADASVILVECSVLNYIAAIAAGHASELFGRRKIMLLLGVARVVMLPVLWWWMASVHSLPLIAVCSVIITSVAVGSNGPLLVFLNERFPTEIRASGCGLSWNVGFAIGGLAPTFVSVASPSVSELPVISALFILGAALIYLLGAVLAPETRGSIPQTHLSESKATALPSMAADTSHVRS
jgi:MHS family proline/betaine transporter-like MFS transporter